MLGARLFDCLGFYVWLACRATHTGRLCFFALFGVRFSALMCAVGRGATARRLALDLRVDDRFLTKHGCDCTERNACDAHRCADRDPRNLLELHGVSSLLLFRFAVIGLELVAEIVGIEPGPRGRPTSACAGAIRLVPQPFVTG
jgi:hypothetical protein